MSRDPLQIRKEFDEMPDDALTDAQVAGIVLKVSPRRVRRLKIPSVDLGPRSRRWRAGDIRKVARGEMAAG